MIKGNLGSSIQLSPLLNKHIYKAIGEQKEGEAQRDSFPQRLSSFVHCLLYFNVQMSSPQFLSQWRMEER